MRESESLLSLKGVGKKTSDLFANLGVYSLGDILSFFPRTYERYPSISLSEKDWIEGDYVAVSGIFFVRPVTKRFKGIVITSAKLTGKDLEVETVWFRMPYLQNQIQIKMPYVAYGRLSKKGSKYRLDQPRLFEPGEYERLTHTPQPVYSLTKGLSNKTVSKICEQALNICLPVEENLSEDLISRNGLLGRNDAICSMHFPKSDEDLYKAKKRFTYEEFLSFFLGHLYQNARAEKIKNDFSIKNDSYYEKVKKNLPFILTNGQENALTEIIGDFRADFISERLIQGDVGSGKTILAFLCMVRMAENSYQSALMAPTEVLAEQHQKSMEDLIRKFDLPFHSVLLTGAVTGKRRNEALSLIAEGKADFIIGTHALIQDAVDYKKLSLVITDEQHRFGVKQRSALGEKGQNPFSLVMSATPIPRTLALILYQGMKVSVISDVPSERLRIKTAIMKEAERRKAWQFIVKEIRLGHQAYIICPLVEETENSSGENVIDYSIKLKETLKDEASVAVLHGRMRPEEKNQIMTDFSEGKIQILVSTTVVEVGVNVPNATVILIENADRFGLSQLHQLRGRVGRGDAQSYCILMNSSSNDKAEERLSVIRNHTSGFDIAEKDLEIRGPGDVSGVMQSGDLPFVMADLYLDHEVMEMALRDANELIKTDPDLSNETNAGIRRLAENGLSEIYTNL